MICTETMDQWFVQVSMAHGETETLYLHCIGPQEVSVLDPAILPAINGVRSKTTKAALYDLTLPSKGLNVTRDRGEHDRRRKVWDPAFRVVGMINIVS